MKTFITSALIIMTLLTVAGCRVYVPAPHPYPPYHHHYHRYYGHPPYGYPVVDEMAQWQSLGNVALKSDGSSVAVIDVRAGQGPFTGILLKVDGSTLELTGITVTFEGGEKFRPSINHFFTEGSRSCVIDLPVGEPRVISSVEITFVKLPEGAQANVELFGR